MTRSQTLWFGIALLLVPFLTAPAAQPPEAAPGAQDLLPDEKNRLGEQSDPQSGWGIEIDESENLLSPVEREQFRQQALVEFSLSDAEIQRIPAGELEKRLVPIRLGSDEFVMKLSPYSMRAESFQLLVQDATGALVPTEPPPPATYRGSLIGQPSAKVTASILDGKLLAMIVTDTQTWFVQPLTASVPTTPDDLHVVFRAGDVIGGQGFCGVNHSLLPASAGDPDGEGDEEPQGGPVTPRGTQGRTEIAFDADFDFYQDNGSSVASTVQDIEMIMNLVGSIFQNQVNICFALTGIIVRTGEPDPYTSTVAGTLLCEFRDFWNANVSIQRDVAHLWTGKNLTGGLGIAWPGVMCNWEGWDTGCTDVASLAYALSSRPTNLTTRTWLTAQEIGHNFNACHCDESACTGDTLPDADCGIMCSNAGCGTTTFGARAVAAITSYRDTLNCLDTCWDPVYVDWNNPGNGTGSWTNPFHTVDEGVRYVPVGGTVIISVGTYPENLTINKSVTLTTASPGTLVTIGG